MSLLLRAGRSVGLRRLSSIAYISAKDGAKVAENEIPKKIGDQDLKVSFIAVGASPYDVTKAGTVMGSSGVAVVDKAGSKVNALFSEGDTVVPIKAGLGTWREAGVLKASEVAKTPANMKTEHAATLWSGTLAAYRVFKEFKPTEAIVVNGAESAFGQALVQIAASEGISTLCIISDNLPGFAPTVEGLKYLGAKVVVAESYPASALKDLVADMGKFSLAVNTTGGSSLKFMTSLVGSEKKMVTVTDTASGKVVGSSFSLPAWMEKASIERVKKTLSEIGELHSSGKLVSLCTKVPLNGLPSEASVTPMPLRTKLAYI